MRNQEFSQEAQRLRPMLIALATRIAGNRGEAEDIVQDALLKLWTLCPQLQPPIDALASVVTRNLARSRLRRRHPSCDIAGIEITGDEEDRAGERPLDHIMRCIDRLPSWQQLVIRLRHIEGMDYASIARLTGSNEAAARKAASRARQALRNQYLEDERK